MNRREVFGRLAGMTAAVASLARIKAPRKAEAKDYGYGFLSYEGKKLKSDEYGYVQVHGVNSTTTLPLFCGQCNGQIYGWYDGRSHVCRGCR